MSHRVYDNRVSDSLWREKNDSKVRFSQTLEESDFAKYDRSSQVMPSTDPENSTVAKSVRQMKRRRGVEVCGIAKESFVWIMCMS